MRLIATLSVIAAFVAVYIIWVRPYLKGLPQFAEIWQQEDSLWAAINTWLEGRRTILIGMWGEVIAFLPDLLQIVSGADLKTALSLPDNWAALVNLAVPILMMIFRAKAKIGV